jgi:glutathione peroxidase
MSKFIGLLLVVAIVSVIASKAAAEEKAPAALNFKMQSLGGKEVDLAQYKGKVVLIVNTASECGLTPQYTELQLLHDKYSKQGLAVLGFPCNQFGKQEPGTAAEIQEFCTANYGVKFNMFAKVDVNGEEACPLYKHLTGLDTKPKGPGKVSWNFEKFLLDRQGNVIARYEPQTSPDAPEVIKAIEAELAKK